MNTHTRETSIEAYNQLVVSGKLNEKYKEIYKTMFYHGPMTSGECFARIVEHKPKSAIISQSRARFTEMREMGLLQELGTRECKITNRNVILWDVTNLAVPREVTDKLTKTQKKNILLMEMRKMYAAVNGHEVQTDHLLKWITYVANGIKKL